MRLRSWSTALSREGEVLAHVHTERCGLGYSPDGRFIYVDDYDINQVTLWDAASRKVVHQLSGRDVGFSPDGKFFTIIRNETNVVIHDTVARKPTATIASSHRLNGPVGPAAISADGRWLALRTDEKPVIIDLTNRRELVTLDAGGGEWLGFTPDCPTLIARKPRLNS